MSDLHLRPLDPELDALLEAERSATPAEAALDRVWSRVALSAGPGAPRVGPSHRATGRGVGVLASRAALIAGVAFAAGAMVGAGLHATLHKAPLERVVYVERPASVQTSPAYAATAPPNATASSSSSLSPQPQPPRLSPAGPVPAPSASSSLSAERAVLDHARTALARDDGRRALTWTDEHARRFTHPQLGEEREAIAIQALVLAGRPDEARARATQFETTWPNSLFLPAVQASLSSIP